MTIRQNKTEVGIALCFTTLVSMGSTANAREMILSSDVSSETSSDLQVQSQPSVDKSLPEKLAAGTIKPGIEAFSQIEWSVDKQFQEIASSAEVSAREPECLATDSDEELMICKIQVQLNNWGFLKTEAIIGKFDESTKEAVIRFQNYHGLEKTGEIDPVTSRVLWEPRIYQSIIFGYLKQGSQGTQVYRVKEQLNHWNIPVNVDKTFDASMRDAIIKFQGYRGLEQDGIIGPETSEMIWTPIEQLSPRDDVSREPLSTGSGVSGGSSSNPQTPNTKIPDPPHQSAPNGNGQRSTVGQGNTSTPPSTGSGISGGSSSKPQLPQPGLSPPNPPPKEGAQDPELEFNDLIVEAMKSLSDFSSMDVPRTHNGIEACAWAVNHVLKEAKIMILGDAPEIGSDNPLFVPNLYWDLKARRGKEVSREKAKAGDIAIARGLWHIGICLTDGCTQIKSNSSSNRKFSWVSDADFDGIYRDRPQCYTELDSSVCLPETTYWRITKK